MSSKVLPEPADLRQSSSKKLAAEEYAYEDGSWTEWVSLAVSSKGLPAAQRFRNGLWSPNTCFTAALPASYAFPSRGLGNSTTGLLLGALQVKKRWWAVALVTLLICGVIIAVVVGPVCAVRGCPAKSKGGDEVSAHDMLPLQIWAQGGLNTTLGPAQSRAFICCTGSITFMRSLEATAAAWVVRCIEQSGNLANTPSPCAHYASGGCCRCQRLACNSSPPTPIPSPQHEHPSPSAGKPLMRLHMFCGPSP